MFFILSFNLAMFPVLQGTKIALRYYISNQRNFFRSFCYSNNLLKLVQYSLSDIGEGIAEVQLKDW